MLDHQHDNEIIEIDLHLPLLLPLGHPYKRTSEGNRVARARNPLMDAFSRYLDDTLIIADRQNRSVHQRAFQHFIEGVVHTILNDDWDDYRCKLRLLGYHKTSRVAEDLLVPLLARIIRDFEVDLRAQLVRYIPSQY